MGSWEAWAPAGAIQGPWPFSLLYLSFLVCKAEISSPRCSGAVNGQRDEAAVTGVSGQGHLAGTHRCTHVRVHGSGHTHTQELLAGMHARLSILFVWACRLGCAAVVAEWEMGLEHTGFTQMCVCGCLGTPTRMPVRRAAVGSRNLVVVQLSLPSPPALQSLPVHTPRVSHIHWCMHAPSRRALARPLAAHMDVHLQAASSLPCTRGTASHEQTHTPLVFWSHVGPITTAERSKGQLGGLLP